MYILNMMGEVLVEFDKWDIKSVARAESWIRNHLYYIFKYECIQGTTYITVDHVKGSLYNVAWKFTK